MKIDTDAYRRADYTVYPINPRTIVWQWFFLCMHPAIIEGRRYIVTSSLIDWAHTQTDSGCRITFFFKYSIDPYWIM